MPNISISALFALPTGEIEEAPTRVFSAYLCFGTNEKTQKNTKHAP